MNDTTIALVTGANRGIGREVVARLAGLGMTVLLGARNPGRGAAAAVEIDGDVHPVTLDVTDPATIEAAAKLVEERYGRLDVLVNNAAITGDSWAPPSATDPDVMHRVFEVNVYGVMRVTNALLPLLRRSAAPRVVNMSSSVGSLTAMADPEGPFAAMPPTVPYTCSKTTLNAVTVQYAKQLRDTGVLVNLACPGYVATDLNRHQGFRTVAQGATIVVELATLPDGGPTGTFRDDDGPIAW